jgi:beta-lactamase superfamily II metal-dependent hydrolase
MNISKESVIKTKARRILHTVMLACGLLILSAHAVQAGETWKVTQELNKGNDLAHMFYTIKGSSGCLIVIDGGYKQNAEYVKSVIKKAGGTVDLWIVTHPHPDHCAAFLQVLNDSSIKIKKIVTTKIPISVYTSNTQFAYDLFKKFYDKLDKLPNVTYVKKGKTIKIRNLKIKFYNSYTNALQKKTDMNSLINKYSLAFRVSAKKKSFFFSADILPKQAEQIAEKYGKEIRSNYLQVPYHGRVSYEPVGFYRTVAPSKAFVDGNRYLNVSALKKMTKVVYLGKKHSVTLE